MSILATLQFSVQFHPLVFFCSSMFFIFQIALKFIFTYSIIIENYMIIQSIYQNCLFIVSSNISYYFLLKFQNFTRKTQVFRFEDTIWNSHWKMSVFVDQYKSLSLQSLSSYSILLSICMNERLWRHIQVTKRTLRTSGGIYQQFLYYLWTLSYYISIIIHLLPFCR